MLRLVISIIYIFIIIFSRTRNIPSGSFDPYSRTNSYNYEYFDIITIISSEIRKFIAVKKAGKYLRRVNNLYFLHNKNIAIEYNFAEKKLKFMDKTAKNRNAMIFWTEYKYREIYSDQYLKREMDDNFFRLCSGFNSESTFKGVVQFYKKDYEFKEQYLQKPKKPIEQKQYVYVDDYFSGENAPKKLLDINSASLDEIKELPGINVILAKRIIQYREKHNGFKSLKELYCEFKIKPHFEKQLNELIFVFNAEPNPETDTNSYFGETAYNNPEEQNVINNNSDRIIDI